MIYILRSHTNGHQYHVSLMPAEWYMTAMKAEVIGYKIGKRYISHESVIAHREKQHDKHVEYLKRLMSNEL